MSKSGRQPRTRVTVCGRVCTKCKKWKPWKSFSRNKNGCKGYDPTCKTCHCAYSADWWVHTHYWQKHRVHIQQRKKATYDSSKVKADHLQRRYGISHKDFSALCRKQKHRCAICGTRIQNKACSREKAAVVDHDHATNAVRGLLCNRCNIGLGCFHDNAVQLRKAASYVCKRHT